MKSMLALLGYPLVGCATTHSTRNLTPLDSGHEVTVKVGDVFTVELPSNRTTG